MPLQANSHEPDSTWGIHWSVHDPLSQQLFNALVAEIRVMTSNLGTLHLQTFEIHLVDWRSHL